PYCSHLPPPSSLFLLSPPLPPRPLHSFPTRRSSDLPPRLGRDDRHGLRRQEPGSHRAPDRHEHRGLPAPRDEAAALADQGLPRQDRKSTRLNSSHVAISYAVFCLKKKKKTKHTITTP